MKKKTVKLEDILYDAELAFWRKVVKHMPYANDLFDSGSSSVTRNSYSRSHTMSQKPSYENDSRVLLDRMKHGGESGLPWSKEEEFRDALEEGIIGWWIWRTSGFYDMELRDGTILKPHEIREKYRGQ